MEELDAVLAQLDARQHKLLFFAPLSAELREQLRRLSEDRNRQLRALFARQLNLAQDGTHALETLPMLQEPHHPEVHSGAAPATATTSEAMTMAMEMETDHSARHESKTKRHRVEEVSTSGKGKERQHDEEDEADDASDARGSVVVVVDGGAPHQQAAEWTVLPIELWVHIISFLSSSKAALKRVARVSKTFCAIARSSVRTASLPRFRFRSLLEQLSRRLDSLHNNCSSLTSLDLSGWQNGGIGHDEHAVNALLVMLHKEIAQLPFRFPALRSLNLHRTGVTAECLASFTRLAHLHTLGLGQCVKLNDEALKFLPPSITKLDLAELPITDEGMKLLPPTLTDLDLRSNKLITPRGLFNLAEHLPGSLVVLSLMRCYHLTEQHIAALPATLTSLDLTYSFQQAVTPSCFQHLPRGLLRLRMRAPCAGSLEHFPTTLTSLAFLSCAELGTADFQRLGALTRLTSLTLARCPILRDGPSLGFLARLTQLEYLSLSYFAKVTGDFFGWVPPSVREIRLQGLAGLSVLPSRELHDRCTITIINPRTATEKDIQALASSARAAPAFLRLDRQGAMRPALPNKTATKTT